MRRAGWWRRPVYRVTDEDMSMEVFELTEAELCAGGVDIWEVEPGPNMIAETIDAMTDNGYEVTRIER